MNLQDEKVLLFDPSSPMSVQGAKEFYARMTSIKIDKSPVAPSAMFDNHRLAVGDCMEDEIGSVKMLKVKKTPILVIAGDKDPGSPPIAWLSGSGSEKLPTTQIIVLPQAGYRPQQQYPELSASYIHSFLDSGQTLINMQNIICPAIVVVPRVRRVRIEPTFLAIVPREDFPTLSV